MALIAAAAIGAAGSIGGSLLGGGGKKSGMSRADKRALGAQELASEKAILRGDLSTKLASKQMAASESARIGLFSRIGDIGTYEESYEDYAARTRGGGGGYSSDSIGAGQTTGGDLFRTHTEKDKVKGNFQYISDISDGGTVSKKHAGRDFSVSVEGQILNVPEFMKQATDSRQFRMMSRLTAEADQMMRQEGPLWDDINSSINGSIMEQSGALHRETMKSISDNLASGGTARRAGMAAIMQMRATENNNRQRVEALWQSGLAVKQWAQDNARTQIQSNTAFVNNHGGIRDSYNQMMKDITMVHSQNIMPSQINAASKTLDGYTNLRNIAGQQQDDQSGLGSIVSGLGTMLFGHSVQGLMQNNGTNSGASNTSPGGVDHRSAHSNL